MTYDNFAEAARHFADQVHSIAADAWDGPGLGEWDLRALVGHTSRSLVTVESYIAQPADAEEVATPAQYYAAGSGRGEPVPLSPSAVARPAGPWATIRPATSTP